MKSDSAHGPRIRAQTVGLSKNLKSLGFRTKTTTLNFYDNWKATVRRFHFFEKIIKKLKIERKNHNSVLLFFIIIIITIKIIKYANNNKYK